MFNKKTVRDLDFRGKTVLLRADYNVPIEDGKISDDYRIRKSAETVSYLLKQKARVVIISHLGRPGGENKPELSLAPVAQRLCDILDEQVEFCPTTVGDGAKQAVKKLRPGGVLLLENLRFHKEEKGNNEAFARKLSELADYFVQDGFGVVHRAHASTDQITRFLPSVAGLLLEHEVTTIENAVEEPVKPLVTVVGGAKISDKIELIDRLIKASDSMVIGGAMANTFLAAHGYEVGESKYDKEELHTAREIMEHAELGRTKLILPILDVAVGTVFSEDSDRHEVVTDEVGPEDLIMDIGSKTLEDVKKELENSGTIIWNGPVGVMELEKFKKGTEEIAKFIVAKNLNCIVGGGDTAGFIHQLGLVEQFTHVSTGGGAALELMAGKKLPGVEALMDKH